MTNTTSKKKPATKSTAWSCKHCGCVNVGSRCGCTGARKERGEADWAPVATDGWTAPVEVW